jgi:hypothetical protein
MGMALAPGAAGERRALLFVWDVFRARFAHAQGNAKAEHDERADNDPLRLNAEQDRAVDEAA